MFIQLFQKCDGQAILINKNHIIAVYPARESGTTLETVTTTFVVKKDYHEVRTLLMQA